MTRRTGAVALFATLGLVACNGEVDRSVCGLLTEMPEGIPSELIGYRQSAYGCTEQWAAKLARAPDPARDIASAVIGECGEAISRFERAAHAAFAEGELVIDWQHWERHAEFIALQTRAGDCLG